MVANGLGVTFGPEIALSAELVRDADVALKPLAEDSPVRRLGLVWRRSYHRHDDVAARGAYSRGRIATLRIKRR
ncbi:LysR substrate-binding domain-containing protein [Algihabitans albus]|uniref:LysR substrate-binding domain-containing protein n=1 Tax=Algihabitans albus TaxID=2164067 RepID=UPI000E5C9A7F